MKENNKSQCYYNPSSFKFPKNFENISIGNPEEEETFEVKRIITIQME